MPLLDVQSQEKEKKRDEAKLTSVDDCLCAFIANQVIQGRWAVQAQRRSLEHRLGGPDGVRRRSVCLLLHPQPHLQRLVVHAQITVCNYTLAPFE